MARLRAVIDTNVLFEGLTATGGAAGAIIDAWVERMFVPCVSQALAYEYVEVLSRKLAPSRWERVRRALGSLLDRSELVLIHYSWRPSSPDPGDELVVDCAMNARAMVVTSNSKDFGLAHRELGLSVVRPTEFLQLLVGSAVDPGVEH